MLGFLNKSLCNFLFWATQKKWFVFSLVIGFFLYLFPPPFSLDRDAYTVSQAHGRVFGPIKPANTLIVVKDLIGDYRVEIEAEALLDSSQK